MTRLIVAIDTPDMDRAAELARATDGHVDAIKLGLEFCYARGFDAVAELARDRQLFLDLKLHDIPNTVAGGLRSLAPLAPALVTIHAAGGRAMIGRAREALEQSCVGRERPRLIAVTVLTSLDGHALHEIGVEGTPEEQVLRLGALALDAGADGLVCSPAELPALRRTFGAEPVLVVPGIRPEGADHGDQARVMTPRAAADAGADWIVVGRPITGSADPGDAARRIRAELTA
ncbi:orotidine-5'-phosphate decarboxylase [Tanticharoenia sakaeratensis]|uniref:Orotidine 5'-phosphate decarboxylase n=1 Tax=Tanticharoenia sakaeratensis NBRC 103193 TaxID=1231623 RepID=A0A0D6MIK9_9PROT|nr:orotidine-5'-phosphate decarboxylase [Tanticharoenia sakaeratensis]GAN53462.1 orotidine 5'-phosphate decarboxylase [Tanticharoenia sakaeratensis NBRC 103193]GBQ17790.1 orotidine 5'-phosphate decarboxylase [Tanticharoenia sakaeratensis NBRC 103193]